MEKPTNLPSKPPLDRESLRDVIDLALWAGQMLLQNGSEARRIEETVHRLGTGLGCDWLDILVSPNAIIATTVSGDEFRTKIRRVVRTGVNMTIIAEVNHLTRLVSENGLNRFEVRQELERIDHLKPNYSRWTVAFMVGLGCAAFSRLFGADMAVFAVTFVASSIAMLVRQELHHRRFNGILLVMVTAFVAGCIASVATIYQWSEEPQLALASSVLLLVPGVPLINSAEDLLDGHVVMGIVRGFMGGLFALAIAVGLLAAMELMGVSGL